MVERYHQFLLTFPHRLARSFREIWFGWSGVAGLCVKSRRRPFMVLQRPGRPRRHHGRGLTLREVSNHGIPAVMALKAMDIHKKC